MLQHVKQLLVLTGRVSDLRAVENTPAGPDALRCPSAEGRGYKNICLQDLQGGSIRTGSQDPNMKASAGTSHTTSNNTEIAGVPCDA